MSAVLSRFDRQLVVWIAVIALATALLLAFSGPYTISIAVGLFTWMYLCVAWNMIGGIVGQVSFGHAAFFGIGGYDSAVLADLKAKGEPAPTNHSPFFAPMPEPAIRNAVTAIILSIVGGVRPEAK